MATRTLVFVGDAQAQALCTLYRTQGGKRANEAAYYVNDRTGARDRASDLLGRADQLLLQITGDDDNPLEELYATRAERILFPALIADFLWPFAGRPHPQNRGNFAVAGGPYPPEHGDGFLDEMIEEEETTEQALARYRELDIAADRKLDAVLARRLAVLAELDELGGPAIAPMVEGRFRDEALFLSRNRPGLALFRALAEGVFGRLGLQPEVAANIPGLPYPESWQPLHPGVIAHFGLRYVTPDHRYPMLEEGRFTFDDYCRRYLSFSWNQELHQGIAAVDKSPERALALLEAGLEASPESTAGWRARAMALLALGRTDAAAPVIARLAALHAETFPDSLPLDAKLCAEAADRLIEAGRDRDALPLLRGLVAEQPENSKIAARLGVSLMRTGELETAEIVLRRAIALAPEQTARGARLSLADTLDRLGRTDAAVAELEALLRDLPGEPAATSRLAALLSRRGTTPKAASRGEGRLRDAVAANPNSANHAALADLLHQQGRVAEAVQVMRALAAREALNARQNGRLGLWLMELGEYDAAEIALRAAIELDPANRAFTRTLAEVIDKRDEAAAAARPARPTAASVAAPETSEIRSKSGVFQRLKRVFGK